MSMPEYRALVEAFAPFEPRPQVRVAFYHDGLFIRACIYHGTVDEALARAQEHMEVQARCLALRKGRHEAVAPSGERREVRVD